MLTLDDKKQIEKKGICEEQIFDQLKSFERGFPFLELENAASVGNGILVHTEDDVKKFLDNWYNYKKDNRSILKFVPASGAASRMFKNMFE